MPLMTKKEVHALAHRIHGYRRQLLHHKEQKDMALAADALMALSDLCAVEWPIAIGEIEMLCTIQDDLGWLAWKGWNMAVFGQGDSEEEAVSDLEMSLERVKRWSSEPWKS